MDDEIDEGYERFLENAALNCRCCGRCWERPCPACCAGGICDDMPCECEQAGDDSDPYDGVGW